jgi:trehalose 6-phosphate phosphatase
LKAGMQSQLEPFFRAVSLAEQSALLLDYDGTLAPFHIERNRAFPYPGVASLLEAIMRRGRTRVIVISGRDANELPPLLNIEPRPEIWGVYGLQRLRVDGTMETLRPDKSSLKALVQAQEWLEYQQLLGAAEFKPGGIAVHWRGFDSLAVEDIRSRVLLGWRSIAEHEPLNLLEFDGGIEILSPGANKGNSVRTILREIEGDAPVAYLGDDSADEPAFRALGDRGISILVRSEPRPTAARFWLRPPQEVVDFLNLWLRSCAGKSASGGRAAKAVIG